MTETDNTEIRPDVEIFTDGACLGNPGPGGWAAVLKFRDVRREISGGFKLTTNNRMEMMSLLFALEQLKKPCKVKAVTDSRYLKDAFDKKWLDKWEKNGWLTADKKPVKNKDLWVRLKKTMKEHELRFEWVRGHTGNPENERCDTLARIAASSSPKEIDQEYMRSSSGK